MPFQKDEKRASEYLHDEEIIGEEKRRASTHAPQELPAALQNLSEQEIDKIGRQTTFKIDVIVMPCFIIMYILNYLDRQNIASARLAGLTEDLNLSVSQYQTCVSILFVGYSKLTHYHENFLDLS